MPAVQVQMDTENPQTAAPMPEVLGNKLERTKWKKNSLD